MKNNAKVGGILSIVAGGWGVLSAFCLIIAGAVVMAMMNGSGYSDYYPGWSDFIIGACVIACGFCWGLLGVLAIVGGVFGVRKRYWGWAMAGSIASILTFWLCGIPAVIFTAMGKPEFEGKVPPEAPAAPLEKIVG